jgi:hypothetical protein
MEGAIQRRRLWNGNEGMCNNLMMSRLIPLQGILYLVGNVEVQH